MSVTSAKYFPYAPRTYFRKKHNKELSWVSETPDPNKCGCRMCEQCEDRTPWRRILVRTLVCLEPRTPRGESIESTARDLGSREGEPFTAYRSLDRDQVARESPGHFGQLSVLGGGQLLKSITLTFIFLTACVAQAPVKSLAPIKVCDVLQNLGRHSGATVEIGGNGTERV